MINKGTRCKRSFILNAHSLRHVEVEQEIVLYEIFRFTLPQQAIPGSNTQ